MSDSNIDDMDKPKRSDKPRGSRRKDRKEKGGQVIRIVVRHLPPTMTESEFLKQVDPLPENESYYYCPADWSLGHEATSRAYMSLKSLADVLQFRDRFDGYVFVDSNGTEYIGIVEYAPFQLIKNKARNHDNKINTIEDEPHYQEFLQKLALDKEEAVRAGEFKIDLTIDRKAEEIKSTPLLQYLALKKEKRREDARKRNEEKRKQREENKHRSGEPEKPKNLGAENKKQQQSGGGNVKKNNTNPSQPTEEVTKSSRSKRRTERDQRRREEHEKRKLMNERELRDKNDQKENVGKEKNTAPKSSKPSKANKDRQKPKSDFIILKKEAKPEVKATETTQTTAKVTTEVRQDAKASSNDTKKAAQPPKSDKPRDVVESETATPGTSSNRAKQRASEERRIRNKDRPSIAIYQPKARFRQGSDENSQNHNKGAVTSTSDCDTGVNNESSNKKSKRFSRRNKSHKSTENCADDRRVSSESSTSANSKIS